MSNLRSYDLRGHLEAAVALDAIGGNMHIDTTVMKIADFKSEVKLPPKLFDVIEHHMSISHSPCRRRSIGPLPSCCFRHVADYLLELQVNPTIL